MFSSFPELHMIERAGANKSSLSYFSGISLATDEAWERFYQKTDQIGMGRLGILQNSDVLY